MSYSIYKNGVRGDELGKLGVTNPFQLKVIGRDGSFLLWYLSLNKDRVFVKFGHSMIFIKDEDVVEKKTPNVC